MKTIYVLSQTYGLKTIQVDDSDFDYLSSYKWHVKTYDGKVFYAATKVTFSRGSSMSVAMHQIILGKPIKGFTIDHVDGNGLNNQRRNLRTCTYSENMRNSRTPISNKSGFKGVRQGWNSRWRADICINSKMLFVGSFKTKIEAAKAYNEAAIKYHGEFAKLNIIPE